MKLIIDSRENSDLADKVIEKAREYNIPHEKKWLEIGDISSPMYALKPSLLLISYNLS